jgi:hypothetical protein
MHISQLHLYTYSPNQLVTGTLKIAYDGGAVEIELSEADRQLITDICVNAFVAERQRIAEQLLLNTPAYVALPSSSATPVDAEFAEVNDEVPF